MPHSSNYMYSISPCELILSKDQANDSSSKEPEAESTKYPTETSDIQIADNSGISLHRVEARETDQGGMLYVFIFSNILDI